MIAGFVVGGIVSLVLLPNTEGYTFVYSSLYPFFFFVIPGIILGLTIISTIGCLIKEPRKEGVLVSGRTHVSTRQAFRVVRRNPVALWFFAFVATMMTFMFMRDLLIPAYSGNVFKMTIKERSGLQNLVNMPILFAMLITGFVSLRVSKKVLAFVGLGVSITGIVIQSVSALILKVDEAAIVAYQTASKNFADKVISQAEFNTALQTWNGVIGGSKGIFMVGIITMGIGLGICVPGLIGLMMDITDKANAAFYIGVWGIASGVGQGLSNLLAGAMRDTAVNVFADNLSFGYGLVFGVQAVGMFAAVLILTKVDVAKFKFYLEKSYQTAEVPATSGIPAFVPATPPAAEVPGSGVVWYDEAGVRTPEAGVREKGTEVGQ
jgi:MFS transporter, BCD family, chlorophyll transporter